MIIQNITLQVLPRGRWTRDVPLFSKDPNLCARNFNDELLACVGPKRLIETFRHFSSNCRNKNNGAPQTTICKKFFRGDGLHPNQTGAKLLGALISRSVCRALEYERSQTSASPPQTVRPQPAVTVETASSVQPMRIPDIPPHSPPRMMFIDAHAPPPPIDDFIHFPALPNNEVMAGSSDRRRESYKIDVELTGYDEAVKSEVKPKNTERVLAQPKSTVPPTKKKDCKYGKKLTFGIAHA